jgi:glycosyltransferase involved in cell wall biosynthesis
MTNTTPTVLFVANPPGLGGSNRSLAGLMTGIGPRVRRVLASPGEGDFITWLRDRDVMDEHLPLPLSGRMHKPRVLVSSLRIAAWALKNRSRLKAIHADSFNGLYLSALAAFLTGVRLVVWVHDPVATAWRKRAAPLLRMILRDVRWVAVSPTARRVALEYGLCRPDQVEVIPNPVVPAEYAGGARRSDGRLCIGFLGGTSHRKGFDLLPEIVLQLLDLDVEWKFFVDPDRTKFSAPVWDRLATLKGAQISVPGRDSEVRRVYEQCDIVFIPSRDESFCRVAAEAMLNGLPVVASDIEPLRDMVGSGQAGLLFPLNDAEAAASAIRRLVSDPGLRSQLGEEGKRRAGVFDPKALADRMLPIYGLNTH